MHYAVLQKEEDVMALIVALGDNDLADIVAS